jgi:hypothetical protein
MTRRIRARVHAGHLEPLEALALPEGLIVEVAVELLARRDDRATPPRFAEWDLGVKEPLTRAAIYDDGI